MGTIKQGILGGFRKKTGTVVGAYWRKLDVIRALPKNTGKAPTQKQIDQQLKFALVTGFLSRFSPLIEAGFAEDTTETPMNRAVAYHIKNAVIGDSPDYSIDLPAVKFSQGTIDLPINLSVTPAAGTTLELEWTHFEPEDSKLSGSDSLYILVYNEAKKRFIRMSLAAPRSAKAYTMQLPTIFAGDAVHVWVAFISTQYRFMASESLYCGELTLLA